MNVVPVFISSSKSKKVSNKVCARGLFILALLLGGGDVFSQTQDMNDLVDDVKAWVKKELQIPYGTVNIPSLDPRTKVEVCPGIKFDFPFVNQRTVRARCQSPKWQLFFRLSVHENTEFLVASREIRAGEIFSPDNVTIKSGSINIRSVMRTLDDVRGKEARSGIRAGDPISSASVASTIMLQKLISSVSEGDVIRPEDIIEVRVTSDRAPANAFRGSLTKIDQRASQSLSEGRILLNTDIVEERDILVLKKSISTGTVLENNMLEFRKFNIRKLAGDHLTDIGGLEEREVIRPLGAGEPLRLSDTRLALLVKKGDTVVISVGRPGVLQVSASMTALESGRVGEQIKVRNNTSGKIVQGIVTGKHTVKGL